MTDLSRTRESRRRWLALAAALATMLPAGAAWAGSATLPPGTLVGDAGFDISVDGPAAGVAFDDAGTLAPGDDTATLSEGVQEVRVTWDNAPFDLSAEAGLRGARVEHGFTSLAAEAIEAAFAALPADARLVAVYLGPAGADLEQGSGAPWPVLGGTYLVGGDKPAMVWPSLWWDMGWGFDDKGLLLPDAVDEGSGNTLGHQFHTLRIVCQGVTVHADFEVPGCFAAEATAASLLPELLLHTELQDASLNLARASGDAVALPRDGATFVTTPHAGDSVSEHVVPTGEPALALHGDAPAALAPASMPEPLPAVAGGPSRMAGASPVIVSTMVPLALAVLAGLAPLAWALYRRILPNRALAHPVRELILERVRAQPGIHESDLARAVGLRHNHVQYHVRVLEDVGVLETRHFGGLKCIFELGKLSPAEKALAMAQRGRSHEVLQLVNAEPGIAQRDLARKLGMTESSAKWHLDRLEQSGVVRTERARGAKRAWAAPGMGLPSPAVGTAASAPPAA
jgi:predicted transcriptional regulator